jgi:CheY-like chemotaxis protein
LGVRVLVVDDDEATGYAWARYLTRGRRGGYSGGGSQAVQALAAGGFDVLLADVVLPDLDGFQLVAGARSFSGRHRRDRSHRL